MTQADTQQGSAQKSMDAIVALCRRRGFIFQSSEIYGGINGFWDYGPLGALLKKNLKDAWWNDLVTCPPIGPDGLPLEMVPLDTTIIMNPKVWEASGHLAGFNDPMVDDRETKRRFRSDHLIGLYVVQDDQVVEQNGIPNRAAWIEVENGYRNETLFPVETVVASSVDEAASLLRESGSSMLHNFRVEKVSAFDVGSQTGFLIHLRKGRTHYSGMIFEVPGRQLKSFPEKVPSPFSGATESLTEPRDFNLMFKTFVGAMQNNDAVAYLRPETAQGIFTNFRNVVDTSRVKVPFGIAQIGKAFRNEVTPRNYTFRSREFEQMEVEFFIPDPEQVGEDSARTAEWYKYWRDARYEWWQSIGLAGDNLQLREHESDELAHYAQEGAGTSDVEYRFPFTYPGFGELEGVAHRTNYDLRQHAEQSGMRDKFKYFDQDAGVKYFPHVIEPSAGADRGTLALLCEAYTPDESRPSKVYMDFHPRMAPIKAAVFPLVNKDGMPERARELYLRLRKRWTVQFDVKQNIGKRYARMDEAGTPYCFTIDGQTFEDDTVTVRERNTQGQERIHIDQVERYLAERIEG
jgi:glycyl-tRNA synthetase